MLDNAIPENCNKYWWRNFLYINNLTEIKEMCIGWTWYLANDMQFYIFAVVLLLISRRYLHKCKEFQLLYSSVFQLLQIFCNQHHNCFVVRISHLNYDFVAL